MRSAEGQRLLIDQPGRLDNVTVVGVDEHVWRHTHKGDTYVTVVIDLTPVRDGTGPSRLVAMVEGRSKQAFKTWLADPPQAWRDGVEVVAMDGFTGFKTATAEELPDATTVMDPFHVVRLAGDALNACRRRVQIMLHGTRGRKHHPLYQNRRILHTGADLLTDTQQRPLDALFADDRHVDIDVTWSAYQPMITAYCAGRRAVGTKIMTGLIASIGHAVATSLVEVAKLGRILTKPGDDVLAFFSTGPAPATALPKRSVSLGSAGLGLAGQDGCRSYRTGCDSRSNWPACGVLPLNCPPGRCGRHRPAHLGDLIRRLPDPLGAVAHHRFAPK